MTRETALTIGRRLTATWLTCVTVLLTILAWVPAAVGVVPPVDAVAVELVPASVPPAADTIPVAPAVSPPPPAVVEAAPVAAQDPVVAATPPPAEPVVTGEVAAPPVAPAAPPASEPTQVVATEPTPAAPQEIIILVMPDAPAATPTPETATPVPVGSEPGLPAQTVDQIGPDSGASAAAQSSTLVAPNADAGGRPVMAPLIVPMVQTLGSGLLSAYERLQSFGSDLAPGQTVGRDEATGPTPVTPNEPSRATTAPADVAFGFVGPPGGWSGQGADILALLMGFLPLGVPDGKSSLTHETQAALLLIGGLLMVIPFLAVPLRDRRRRGPRGFATLVLRPG